MADEIRVLFGTETGTAEMCGSDLVDALKKRGYPAKLVDMDDYRIGSMASDRVVVVITSTFGNGDPPANAEALLESLRDDRPDLSSLAFAVMALGDSSYPRFAQCGKDFHAIIEELGGNSVIPRVDCDGDVDAPFSKFQKDLFAYLEAHPDLVPRGTVTEAPKKGLLGRLKSWFGSEPAPAAPVTPPAATGRPAATTPAKPGVIDRHNPGTATVVSERLLSKVGSTKETRHYVLDLGSAHSLRGGDCIGVYARNPPALVSAVVKAAGLTPSPSLSDALGQRCLRRVTTKFLEAAGAEHIVDGDLQGYLDTHHVLQALRDLKPDLDAQTLVESLHPLAPRLFSVANNPKGGHVDLCVETTRYTFQGEQTAGVASCWLADQLTVGDSVPWYPHANPDFHRPSGPVIMVGPGTGIAPFRGWLQEMADSDQKSWLFFGHRHSSFDDLYGDELLAMVTAGTLTKLSHAWSRDQDERVYVQQRIAEQGEELWSWLQDGASVRVCGAAIGMAPGVRAAFSAIAAAQGQDGEAWLAARIEDGSYLEDVY